MSKVILDTALKSKLNGLQEELELCDEAGHTLGHFLPPHVYRKLVTAYYQSVFTDEEIERARKQLGGRSLEEIWKTLGRA
jgi:hypothetical protein